MKMDYAENSTKILSFDLQIDVLKKVSCKMIYGKLLALDRLKGKY